MSLRLRSRRSARRCVCPLGIVLDVARSPRRPKISSSPLILILPGNDMGCCSSNLCACTMLPLLRLRRPHTHTCWQRIVLRPFVPFRSSYLRIRRCCAMLATLVQNSIIVRLQHSFLLAVGSAPCARAFRRLRVENPCCCSCVCYTLPRRRPVRSLHPSRSVPLAPSATCLGVLRRNSMIQHALAF